MRSALLLLLFSLGAATAGAQGVFGRNKVVYADRDWQVLESGQVQVYYYEEERELARETLGIAVEAYADLAEYFDFEFEEPIPIILYGTHHDFKQSHVTPGFIPDGTAGFTEFIKGRVAVRATGNFRELRHLVRHELVHAFMLSELAEVMGERGLFDYTGPPLWFIEGLAESVARQGPADSDAQMFLRDAVLQDGLVHIRELWSIEGSFLMYKEGESIVDFLRAQYGDRLPALLIDRWWMGRDLEDLLELELGLDYAELDERWVNYLKRRHFPELLTRRAPIEQGDRLLEESFFDTAPVLLERDGDALHLACLSARRGTLSLFEVRVSESEEEVKPLIEGGRSARFEVLPAFRSRLDVHESWLAFVAKSGGEDALYVYDVQNRRIVHSLSYDDLRQISSPSFSPDGSQVVFSGLGADGYSDLYRVELASGELERLTHDTFDDVHPDWHPDGDRVVFASDRPLARDGRMVLFTLALRDGSIEPLPIPPGNATEARWSADGQSLLFVSDSGGVRNAFVHSLRDGTTQRITDLTGGVYAPDWLGPDEIVVSVFHRGGFGLHRFPLAGASSVATETIAWPVQPEHTTPPELLALEEAPTERDYEVKLGLDLVGAAVALDPDLPYGSGASAGFSDLLGDHQLSVHLATTSEEFDLDELNAGVSYSNFKRRLNKHVGAFRLSTVQRFTDLRPRRIETRSGAFGGLTYPLSIFDRVEFTSVARHLERDASLQLPGDPGTTWQLSFYAGYVHDDALWTWDGPSRGKRYHLTLGQTFDLLGRGFDHRTIQFDGRAYRELPGGLNLAGRIVHRRSFGSDTQFYYLGGPTDLRGYDWYAFFGDRLSLANLELRVPVLDRIALAFPFGPFELPGVHGALFADAAEIGGPIFDTGWIGSYGYGFYMTLYPPFVFRLDVARPHDFDRQEPWDVDLSLSWLY